MSFFSLIRAFSRILIATYKTAPHKQVESYQFLGELVSCQLYFAKGPLPQIFTEHIRSQFSARCMRILLGLCCYRALCGCLSVVDSLHFASAGVRSSSLLRRGSGSPIIRSLVTL